MNMKRLLYAFVLPLVLFTGQLFAQGRVVTGRVTELKRCTAGKCISRH